MCVATPRGGRGVVLPQLDMLSMSGSVFDISDLFGLLCQAMIDPFDPTFLQMKSMSLSHLVPEISMVIFGRKIL